MNYSTFKTDIAAYAHRGDLTAIIPQLIANAEAYLFRELQAVELEGEVSGTITSNTIAMPADFQAVQRLEVSTPSGDKTLAYASGEVTETTVTANPVTYTVEGTNLRIVQPVADGTAYTLKYSAKLAALSDSNTTNWLLDNAIDLYKTAVMAEVGSHTKNYAMQERHTAMLPALLESVRSASTRKKYPVRGQLQIKPRR